MILYHGSNLAIPQPDILHSRPYVDFGRGFYVTPLKEQAEQWCKRYKRQGKEAVLSIYSMDERKMAERKLLSLHLTKHNPPFFSPRCGVYIARKAGRLPCLNANDL